MAIVGVQTVIYGVEDLAVCEKFFTDFGLMPLRRSREEIDFVLPEGSHIILRHANDPELPVPFAGGSGVRRVVWGVDSAESLAAVATELGKDRAVSRAADGTITCEDDAGLPIGFRVFHRETLVSEEEFTNAPG